MTPDDLTRYQRQMVLPEIGTAGQARLKDARVLIVGAGGLGAAALPYLAGAGIGHITIIDHDTVSISNLHRQTIYTNAQAGQNKARFAAEYAASLNPAIEIAAVPEKLGEENAGGLCTGFDLILDGTDNFAAKYLLNDISIRTRTPLVSASVERFTASAGIFAGHIEGAPCYACLFPAAPENACNCAEGGVLGTAAGLAGLWQAHLALCFLLNIENAHPGTILSFDFKNFRMQNLSLAADPACVVCAGRKTGTITPPRQQEIPLLSLNEVSARDHIIIDVRSPEETAADPINRARNIPLPELPARIDELPRGGTLIALVCQANIRSRMGAEMLRQYGVENVCVLDRASCTKRAA